MMQHIKYDITILILFCFLQSIHAQEREQEQTACAQSLRSARALYDDGRLHELPLFLQSCLTQGNKEEKVEALRLLTLTYIYLGEPDKADEHMVRLLKVDNFFETNEAVDPAEFISLYNQYRTWPIFSLGLYFGINNTQNNISNVHYVLPDGAGQGKFTSSLNISIGLSFEKEISDKWTISPELVYVNRSYDYVNNEGFRDSLGITIANSGNTGTYNQSWLDFNALAQYKFHEINASSFYFTLGPSIQYVLRNNVQPETRTGNQVISGAGIDMKDTNNPINYAISVGVGGRFRLGAIYFRPDIRYQYGISNIVDTNNRQQNDSETLLRYGLPNPDFRSNNIQFNLAIVYPVFKPKKLTQP